MVVVPYIAIREITFNHQEVSLIDNYGKIYKVVSYDDYNKIYVKVDNLNYYFNVSKGEYASGNYIYIKGTVKEIPKEHYQHGFNYHDYLKYQNIVGQISVEEIKVLKKGFGLNIFHEKINNYIRSNFDKENGQIIQALIIGEKHNLDQELNLQINSLGISHLFVISGLHIELINKAIDKLLSFFKLKPKYKNIITLIILFFYYILTSLLVSILRVIISFIFNKILKNKLRPLTQIDRLCLNAIIVLIINPYNLFSYSFLLSYMIVFGILIISPKLKKDKKFKSFIFNNLLISSTSTIISLPIVVRISADLNLLSIILNLFFIPFVSYILLPFSFVVFVIPKLEFVYSYVVKLFMLFTNVLSKIDVFVISFSYIPLGCIIIFYLLFLLTFNNKKYKLKKKVGIIFIIYLIFLYYLPYFNPVDEVSFLDLPSGDATFIHIRNNKKNVLIDTGDVDAEVLISFLKSKGVKKLDAVIISHGDTDHIGGLKSLINEFKINSIFVSSYDSVSIELVENFNLVNTNIYYLKAGDEFYIDELYFKVLWPFDNEFDINNNSLVIYAEIFKTKFLFTGDIEKVAEIKFIKKYKNLNVDVLKVAHHGSKTSSTSEFLESVKFKYAIAMNGYANTFDFPHDIVVNRIRSLKDVVMFNTLEYGTVSFYRFNKKMNFKIKTSFMD